METSLNRAKPKDIKSLREQYLQEQMGLCALCREPVDPLDAVLDHCHKTGLLRAVLHRGCNCYIGSMENNLARNQITPTRLANILANFERYKHLTKPILHPTYRTAEEKKARTKKRAQTRRRAAKGK
jgi:hypothetical protein